MAITNSQSKFYVSSTPVSGDQTQEQFEALSWTEVKFIVNLGETGNTTNVLTLNTWDTDVVQKAGGTTDAGSPTLEVAETHGDPGQDFLRSIAGNNLDYAFKLERKDAPLNGTPTTKYNRGLVFGPTDSNGGNEDFVLQTFTLGLQQRQLTVPRAEPTP